MEALLAHQGAIRVNNETFSLFGRASHLFLVAVMSSSLSHPLSLVYGADIYSVTEVGAGSSPWRNQEEVNLLV